MPSAEATAGGNQLPAVLDCTQLAPTSQPSQVDDTAPDTSGHTAEVKGPPTKRRRVGTACTSCRFRRSKCDGKQPCASCFSNHAECEYVYRRRVTLDYVKALEKLVGNAPVITSGVTISGPTPWDESASLSKSPNIGCLPATSPPQQCSPTHWQTNNGPVLQNSQQRQNIGGMNLAAGELNTNQVLQQPSYTQTSQTLLLDYFHDNLQDAFPVLDWPLFEKQSDQDQSHSSLVLPTAAQRISHATVNIVLAISAQHRGQRGDSETSEHDSDATRSYILSSSDVLGGGLPVVQLLLLYSYHQRGFTDNALGHRTSGLALLLSDELRINEGTFNATFSAHDRCVRQQIWSCALEMHVSMSIDISPELSSMRPAIGNSLEHVISSGELPSTDPFVRRSRDEVNTLTAFAIKILDHQRQTEDLEQTLPSVQHVSSILSLQEELIELHRNVYPWLKLPPSQASSWSTAVQAHAWQSHYNEIRILLFRPMIKASMLQGHVNGLPLQHHLIMSASKAGLDAASDQIGLVCDAMAVFGTPWTALSHVSTSALLLLEWCKANSATSSGAAIVEMQTRYRAALGRSMAYLFALSISSGPLPASRSSLRGSQSVALAAEDVHGSLVQKTALLPA